MFFFTPFPTITTDNDITLTDITKRFSLLKTILSDDESYQLYSVNEWDTPESIAEKFYGNERYSWLILLANRAETNNVFSCFYRSDKDMFNHCKKKYGTHLYEITSLKDANTNETLDELDFYYYYNKPFKLKGRNFIPITHLDSEKQKNEDAKIIKIINPYLIQQVEVEIINSFAIPS